MQLSDGKLKEHKGLGLMTSTAVFLFCFFQWEKLKWCTKFCFFPSLSHIWKIIKRLNLGDSLYSIWNLLVALLARGRVPVAQSTNYLKEKRKMLPVIPSRSSVLLQIRTGEYLNEYSTRSSLELSEGTAAAVLTCLPYIQNVKDNCYTISPLIH